VDAAPADRRLDPQRPGGTTATTPRSPQPRSAQFSQVFLGIATSGGSQAYAKAAPTETGIMEREMKRLKNGRYYLIPASEQTAGHGTTGQAKWSKQKLSEFLQTAPRRAP
jgi:hypothetical protein